MGVINAEKEGETEAERFRRDNALGWAPIGDLVTTIEQATDIDVAVLDVGPDEHGMTLRDPVRDAKFIGVARTDRPMRQRSSLAHELAHAVFNDCSDGEPADWSRRSPEESRADAFARHLLIPIDGLHAYLGEQVPVTESVLSDVVQRFLVSPAIAAIALHQDKRIDEETKDGWMHQLSAPMLAVRYGWIDQYRALAEHSNKRRAPQRLLARAIDGYELGVLSAQAIATLCHLPLDVVKEELRMAGINPPTRSAIAWASVRDIPDLHVDLSELDRDLTDGVSREVGN